MRSERFTSTLLRAIAVCATGALLGIGITAVRPGGFKPWRYAAPVACAEPDGAVAPVYIEAADASILCGHPGVVIADARPAARYAEGHVAGAVHLPCDASGPLAADVIARFAGARTIVVYGQTTEEAVPVAESLQRRHLDARVLKGGFDAWSHAGLACASGPCDECTEAHR